MCRPLELPTFAIIPYHIQEDKNLPDCVKLFFGQIVGLSKKEGYIFATDEQLAGMKKTSIRNIQRWLVHLENAGYIQRETICHPKKLENGSYHFEKKRKIFINESLTRNKPFTKSEEIIMQNSKNVSEHDKNVQSIEHDKNVQSIEHDKNVHYKYNISKDTSIKQQPSTSASPVVVSLNSLNILDSLKQKISANHSEQEINLAVSRCLKWKSRPSDDVGIITALSKADEWIDNPEPNEIQEKNKEFLESKLRKFDSINYRGVLVSVGPNYIEFVNGHNVNRFSIDEIDFKSLVLNHIEHIKIRTENSNN